MSAWCIADNTQRYGVGKLRIQGGFHSFQQRSCGRKVVELFTNENKEVRLRQNVSLFPGEDDHLG